MYENFLVVKGMTLMGEGGLVFKQFASNLRHKHEYFETLTCVIPHPLRFAGRRHRPLHEPCPCFSGPT